MGEWCLVTGASGGIGAALAREAAAAGYGLILSARSTARLEPLAEALRAKGADVVTIAADLGQEGAAEALWQEASQGRDIAVLVNNAGLGVHGPWGEGAIWPREAEVIAVNAVAAAHLMKYAALDMVAAGRGRILNVASAAAFMTGPTMATYHATKAFLLSLSEAAHSDLKGTGVSVTALCPGPTDTGFFDTAGMQGMAVLKLLPLARADRVAKAGWRGAIRGRRLVVPGVLYKLVAVSLRVMPRGLQLAVARLYWHRTGV